MKKILLKHKPIIHSYHYDADLLSIIPEHKNYMNWLMNNYIQLEAPSPTNYPNDDSLRVDFYHSSYIWECCPLISYQRVKREFVSEKWESVIDFIISSIKLGYYLYMDVDRYYIPGSVSYLKYESLHDIFVYGFDEEEKIIYFSDFFENSIYRDSTISFENFEKAYQKYYNLPIKPYLDKNCIELISLDTPKHRDDYNFNISKVKTALYDYIYSCNSYKNMTPARYNLPNKQNNFLGISVYYNLLYYIELMFDNNEYFQDMRAISIFCNHKKLMLIRLNYMGNKGYLNNADEIYNQYRIIETEMIKVKYLLIKLIMTSKIDIIEKIKKIIFQIIEDEKNILLRVLDNITDRKIYESNNFALSKKNDITDIIPMRGLWEYLGESQIHGYSDEDNAYAISKICCDNFIYESDICLEDCTAASLLFRGNKYLTKFYCANLDVGGYVKLWRPQFEIAIAKYPIKHNIYYHLKVKAHGDSIQIYLNDVLIIDAVDNFIKEGYLGFNIFENKAKFKNIKHKIL